MPVPAPSAPSRRANTSRIRQRMAPAGRGDGTGKIAIEMQELRAGNVRLGVLRFTPARIAELEAAVEQRQIVALEL